MQDVLKISYVRNGLLYIKPTLTADRYDESFILRKGSLLDLTKEGCNILWDGGCQMYYNLMIDFQL